jgi:hypothetical protein
MSTQINIRRVEDEMETDEAAARAAQSMDRMTSLRVSLFNMTFSFVTKVKAVEVERGFEDVATISRAV